MNRLATYLFYIMLLLVGIGVVMIYSTSAILAQEKFADATYFLKKELLWVSIGLLGLYVGYRVPYRIWIRYSWVSIVIAVIFLILVLLPFIGHQVGGARRWLKFGGFGFQPSELAKYALIMFLAKWLSDYQDRIKTFTQGFLIPIVFIGLIVGLILIQPDLGSSLGLGTIALMMLFVAGVRWRYLVSLFIVSLPLLYYFVAGVAYRRARILAFLDPWKDPKGVGFQIIQSFIALGSGGLTGVGLGESRQKLFYLPEAHTDFIFSIIGEELGFIGALMVCLAFFALFALGFRIVLRVNDLKGHLLGLGIIGLFALHTLVNIGVVTGSLPTKGLPMPFISFGGSSLVLSMTGVGILMNLAGSMQKEVREENRDWRQVRRVRVRSNLKRYEGIGRPRRKK